jgi:hypothetical protein
MAFPVARPRPRAPLIGTVEILGVGAAVGAVPAAAIGAASVDLLILGGISLAGAAAPAGPRFRMARVLMSKAAGDFVGVGGLALFGGAIYALLPRVFANKMNERRREAARAARVWAWIWILIGTACLVIALVLLLVDQAS